MGILTPNNIFYKPDIGAQGATEKGKFDDGLDVADGLIEANKPGNNKLSAFAPTTSAELAGVISDETGSGKAVFHNSPTLVSPKLGEAEAVKIDLTGGQIKFPAMQNPSADPNTEDDYEEGEWTIRISFGYGETGITYVASKGFYTKVGNIVTISGQVSLISKGSSTGQARVVGFPFNVANDVGAETPLGLFFYRVKFANQLVALNRKNTSDAELFEVTEGGVISVLNETDFSDNTELALNCTYRVS